ncbi:(2Fe-2S)-binding protein [Mycobacterium sp. ML4]
MFVCLCNGVTSQQVADVVAAGASTTNQVAAACGAGTDCGRCRRTVRAIIAAADRSAEDPAVPACRPALGS